jgi:predicted RNA binding protein YcfA (HicA-like mRNA interferase family)
MGRCDKLLAKARRAPNGLTFRELCALADCYGFELRRIAGSHRAYQRPGLARPLSFQPVGKMARGYQVRQLVKAIDEGEEPDG